MSFPARWDDISDLQHGTEAQRRAYQAIKDRRLLDSLAPFAPVLCGTVPLGLDVPGSDLDIICEALDLDAFERAVSVAFSDLDGHTSRRTVKNGFPTVICNFRADGWPVEIFCQPRPVAEGNAYRHMVVEARLLALAGDGAAEEIRRLRLSGLKTEPAFAACFGLGGNPYETLLLLSGASDSDLLALVSRSGFDPR